MKRTDVSWLVAILARECRLAFRGARFWAVAAAGALLAAWRAAVPDASSAIAAYRASEAILLGLGVVAIFLAASAAGRDRRRAVTQLVLAKPQGSRPSLVLVRLVAVWLSLAALAAIMLAASSLAQVTIGESAWRLSPYVHALAHTILPVGLAAALGFSLCTIFTTPLASAVAAMYWLVIPLTRPHTAMAFDLTLSQHWHVTALLTAFLMVLTAALYARTVRDRGVATTRLAYIGAILLIAAGTAAYGVATAGDDALLGPDPVLAGIASQSSRDGPRAPGFWLPDSHGSLVALSDHAGRPVVITFWGPAVSDSARSLSALRDLAAGMDITCIAICVDRDPAAMRPFLHDAGIEVVMLWDRGRHFGDGGYSDDSPTAVAYEVELLPATFILDSQRRLADTMLGDISFDRLSAEVAGVIEQ